jgi:hypothetical protein
MSQLTVVYVMVWIGAAAMTIGAFFLVVVPIADTIAAVVERCG